MNKIVDIIILTVGAIFIAFAGIGLFNSLTIAPRIMFDPRIMFLIVMEVGGVAFVCIGLRNVRGAAKPRSR
jgi:hypothetical protein